MAVEQVGVPAEPSEAGLGRPFALEHRARVDVGASDGVGALAFKPRSPRREPVPARCHGSPVPAHRPRCARASRRANRDRESPVRRRDTRGSRPSEARIDQPRVEPPLGIATKPSHLARPPRSEPSVEKLFAIIEPAKRREADQHEALLVRCRGENLFQSSHRIVADVASIRTVDIIAVPPRIIAQLREFRSRFTTERGFAPMGPLG